MTPLTIQLVVFDWAGTTIDFGCMAPAGAFVAAFAANGVDVTLAEARGPMGLHKKDHIRAMLCTASVGAKWRAAVGRVPLLLLDSDIEENDADLRGVTDRLYGGDQNHRIRQEFLVGVGGVRAVRAFCAISGSADERMVMITKTTSVMAMPRPSTMSRWPSACANS